MGTFLQNKKKKTIMSDTHEKFKRLTALPYNEQAIWFLNGFWGDGIGSEEANQVWKYIEKFVELDLMGPDRKGGKGNELDVFWSARFLEDMDKAITAKDIKKVLTNVLMLLKVIILLQLLPHKKNWNK